MTKAARGRGTLRAVAFTVTLTAVPLIGLGLGALTAALVSEDATEVPSEAGWIPVETSPLVSEQRVDLDLTWDEPAPVHNPGWSGLVTAAFVKPGDVVTTGTPVIEVNGIRRLAYSAAQPLFEPVNGESGASARATLSAFLSSLGYSPGGSSWNRSMVGAVRAFARDIGVPSAEEVTEFDWTWIVWIPADGIRIGGGLAQVGSTAADEVFTLPAQLTSISPAQDETVPDLSAQKWMLTIGESSSPVSAFPLESPDQLAGFAVELGGSAPETTSGILSLETSIEGWAVTSSSVIVGPAGEHCLVAADPGELEESSDTKAFRVMTVDLLPGSPPGVAWIGGELPASAAVLTHPADSGDDYPCE